MKNYFTYTLLLVSTIIFAQVEKAKISMQLLNYSEAVASFENHDDELTPAELVEFGDVLYYTHDYARAMEVYGQAENAGATLNSSSTRNYKHCQVLAKEDFEIHNETYFIYPLPAKLEISDFCSNSEAEDFAPFYKDGNLYFSTSRELPQNINTFNYSFTNLPFLQVVAMSTDCNKDKEAIDLPIDLNGQFHSGPMAFSPDSKVLICTKNYQEPNSDDRLNLHLVYYTRVSDFWLDAKVLPFCSPEYSVQHAVFTPDGKKIVFSSNMPGGFGGFDLYTSTWNGTSWGNPVLLGDSINTVYDEVFPFFTTNDNLGYSTNHIDCYGGLDIVIYFNHKRWLLPAPMNSLYDEFGLTFESDSVAYFSSNRTHHSFDDDIFRLDMSPLEDLLKGQEVEAQPEEVIVEAAPVQVPATVAAHPIAAGKMEYDQFKILFDHDIPRLGAVHAYEKYYGPYLTRKADYLNNSETGTYGVNTLFNEVEEGKLMLDALLEDLQKRGVKPSDVKFHLNSYASPIGNVAYNKALSERRNIAVQLYILGWNNGAFNNAKFEMTSHGEVNGNPFVSDNADNPASSIYGVSASRMRYTEVTVSFKN